MRFPHTLLIGLAALVLWGASRWVAAPLPKRAEDVPALAIPGSAFGSLAARSMRGSLYAYWHNGEAFQAPAPAPPPQAPTANTPPPPPPPTPGVFSRRRLGSQTPAETTTPSDQAAPPPPQPEVAQGPPLDRAAAWLNVLEKRRTLRKGPVAFSTKHIQYLNAATGWRLRLAYNLDPGDPMLYEILHHHILTTSQNIEQARARSRLLTDQALAHAHSSQADMDDTLTGVAAAINALNETIAAAQPNQPSKEELLVSWQEITSCQNRFHELRAGAEQEGWWWNIPSHRRAEIDQQAAFLSRLTKQIQEFLVKNSVLVSHQ